LAATQCYRLKAYSNEKRLRRVFQGESSTSNFTERGEFSAMKELSGAI
jgi:hypothetical protein